MIIVFLTLIVAGVLGVPATDWHLAVLVPLEIVYAAISWFAAVQYLGRMVDGERRNVGWGTKLFAPELVLLFLVLALKGGAEDLWESWNRWLGSLDHTTYVRAFCGTGAALTGFCLTVAAFAVEKEFTLAQVPLPLLLFVAVAIGLSIVTTIRGGESGKWYSRWLLLVGFIILWECQMGRMNPAVAPFSITFFALYLGRFAADLGWKRGTGNEIASAVHSQ